jgi:hypothetical protein
MPTAQFSSTKSVIFIEKHKNLNLPIPSPSKHHSIILYLSSLQPQMINAAIKRRTKELRGSLNHLAITTRPDISLAVSKLCQFLGGEGGHIQYPFGDEDVELVKIALVLLNERYLSSSLYRPSDGCVKEEHG